MKGGARDGDAWRFTVQCCGWRSKQCCTVYDVGGVMHDDIIWVLILVLKYRVVPSAGFGPGESFLMEEAFQGPSHLQHNAANSKMGLGCH